MTSDVEKKRAIIMNAYKTHSWKLSVKAMSDSQVIAVYIRLKNKGKI